MEAKSMYLQSLATTVPPAVHTQPECWEIIQRSPARDRLAKRSRLTLQSILRGEHGIARRHFAAPDITRIFEHGSDELNAIFRTEAPRLASRALDKALTQAGVAAAELDALLICTCTGYLCPGLTSYVAEQLGLRPDLVMQDLVGLGCGAALPLLRSGADVLATRPEAVVACVAVEVCSAAFYLDDDPGVLVSACLFSDGAAATIWRGSPGPTGLRAFGFRSLHLPAERDKIRFEHRDGKLRNLLDPGVPALAAGAVGRLWAERGPRPVAGVVCHPGGRDVLAAIEPVVAPHPLAASAAVLREHGNMSSPSVLFALEEHLRAQGPPRGGDLWLTSFGAGFSAHSCRIGHP
jgi:predicted naringenin-chalcone synthase